MRAFFIYLVIVIGLTYAYLYPGSQAMVEGRTDTVMGDGTDGASLPGAYDMLLQVWKHHPSRFWYAAIYSDYGDPDVGSTMAMPWNERWIVLLSSMFFALEQLSTSYVFMLLILNALAMYALGRYLKWPKWVAMALGTAWAFSCYTRARAKVHMALSGVYHLPLIFLGLYMVARGRDKKSLFLAALAFLAAGTVAHYYIFTCMFLSPFFLVFLAVQPEFKTERATVIKRMVVAIAPLLLFLSWNYFFVLPSDARLTGSEVLNAGVARPGEQDNFILYLRTYHDQPLDFLGGDIALQASGPDLNPLRRLVNDQILGSLVGTQGNTHERTNGIRWSILLLSGLALWELFRKKSVIQGGMRREFLYFFIFGLFTFWLSLSPDFPFEESGASYLMFSVFHKIRVASRAGIQVHFALIMLTGLFLTLPVRGHKWRQFLTWPLVLLVIFLIDYFPLQTMPMAPILPAYTELNREKGPCGMGMAFPFFSPHYISTPSYIFSQRMRGSDCTTLNLANAFTNRVWWMIQRFPPTGDYLGQLTAPSSSSELLEKIARCVPLNWIVFHEATPRPFVDRVCQDLGWRLTPDLVCVAPDRNQPFRKPPEQCDN